jgi:hypothetical protein
LGAFGGGIANVVPRLLTTNETLVRIDFVGLAGLSEEKGGQGREKTHKVGGAGEVF